MRLRAPRNSWRSLLASALGTHLLLRIRSVLCSTEPFDFLAVSDSLVLLKISVFFSFFFPNIEASSVGFDAACLGRVLCSCSCFRGFVAAI